MFEIENVFNNSTNLKVCVFIFTNSIQTSNVLLNKIFDHGTVIYFDIMHINIKSLHELFNQDNHENLGDAKLKSNIQIKRCFFHNGATNTQH